MFAEQTVYVQKRLDDTSGGSRRARQKSADNLRRDRPVARHDQALGRLRLSSMAAVCKNILPLF